MFRSYFKTTIRNLWRNKSYSLLNIIGLAVGISCAALIFLWVEDEVGYDKFNSKKDLLYFVRVNQKYDSYVFTHWSTPGVLAPSIREDIPGIANTCRTTEDNTRLLFSTGDKSLYASGKYAESSLFSMFTLPFIQGNAASAFKQLNSIVITEKTAKKFFGNDKNLIGRSIKVDNKQDYIVTGVLKDIPSNSSLQFEWLAPFDIYYQQSPWAHEWGNTCLSTYVELKPGVSPSLIDKQLYNFIQKRKPASISRPFLFSMKDWHLYDQFENGKETGGGRIQYVRLFSIIAWIIILIACINFMNLTTARSEKRAREVGVRKVLGAEKKKLVVQFMGEALFMSFIAVTVAVLITVVALPAFNLLVQKDLSPGLNNPFHIIAVLLIALVCGLVAGSYPSFYLSSFRPVAVLKGIKIKTGNAAFVRRGLVVIQFAVSIALIISTVIIYQQVQHVKSRELGFNKDNLVEVSVQGEIGKHYASIRQDLLNTGIIDHVALSDHPTLYGGNNTDGLNWEGKTPGSKILVSGRNITPGFFATSGMKILQGRDLNETDTMQTNDHIRRINCVITQSLARLLGNQSPLGKTMFNEGDASTKLVVVGVVNDYVYGYMYGKPDPVGFALLSPVNAQLMYVHIKSGSNVSKAVAAISDVAKKYNPAYPFEYKFVDDQFNQMFLSEKLISELSQVFAALAIIISCLGLFGLAAYTAERRTKEIGIRKVLGASARRLAGLLSKEFLLLVLVSCLIAFPAAWFAMNSWLQNYPYRININLWVFVIAGLTALLIALVTVSFQAVKTAMANPVKSLRIE